MNRTEKVRAKARRTAEWQNRRRSRCARVLDAIGLGDGFRGLRDRTKDLLAAYCRPLPEIDTEALGPAGNQLKADILQELAEATVSVSDTAVVWPDVYSVLWPLAVTLVIARVDRPTSGDPDVRYLERARHVCAEHTESIASNTVSTLGDILVRGASGASDLDLRIVWPCVTEFGDKWCPSYQIRFEVEPSQLCQATVDGKSRPVFRCGGGWGGREFRWVFWPSEILGESDGSDGYPVYVQRHALDRLGERLWPLDHATMQYSLFESLANPTVLRGREADTYLVDYRLAGSVRSGYLLARRLGDKVIVTTFLFLTMQGTPESRQLAERLRLRRPDIEYAGLDSLSGFINSDLAGDTALAKVFVESGCEDLLKLACTDFTGRPVKAAGLRAYLGLAPQPNAASRLNDNPALCGLVYRGPPTRTDHRMSHACAGPGVNVGTPVHASASQE